jgi:hypothetical protein
MEWPIPAFNRQFLDAIRTKMVNKYGVAYAGNLRKAERPKLKVSSRLQSWRMKSGRLIRPIPSKNTSTAGRTKCKTDS